MRQPPVGFESLKGQRKLEACHGLSACSYHQRTEITHLFEVRTNSEDLVYKVFNGENVVFAKGCLNNSIVVKRNALLVHFAITTLIYQFANGLEIRLAAK